MRRRPARLLLVLLLTVTGAVAGSGTATASGIATASGAATASGPVASRSERVGPDPGGPFRRLARDRFDSAVAPVSPARLGSSYRAGCPVGPADLRLVTVTTWGLDGRTHRGELVVAASVAADVVSVFRALHAARFPVARVDTVERYGSDDDRVMAANVTSAYSCRRVTGGTAFSEHSYGTALDVNPVQNPYVRGSTVEPPTGRNYLDRGDVRPGMIVTGGPVTRAFAAVGWSWGGSFRSLKDYQHFSLSGR